MGHGRRRNATGDDRNTISCYVKYRGNFVTDDISRVSSVTVWRAIIVSSVTAAVARGRLAEIPLSLQLVMPVAHPHAIFSACAASGLEAEYSRHLQSEGQGDWPPKIRGMSSDFWTKFRCTFFSYRRR